MKKIVVSILFVMFAFVPAAQSQGISEADMQNMMQMMQKMQECMAKVDQADMQRIEEASEKLEAEIKALCEQGKKKKAQKKAIAFGKEMMDNPALKQMRKCSEITKGLLPEGSAPQPSFEDEFDFSNQDVCSGE